MTAYDRWLESPYTDVDDIECDECDKCVDECTLHEDDDLAGQQDFFDDLNQQAREEDARNEREGN